MKFALCNEMFVDWDWTRICDISRELGYQGLEVAPFTLADRAEAVSSERRAELRRTAESRGLEILGLHWLLVKPPGLHMTHPDAPVRRQTSDYFVELVKLCADLGGNVLVIGSPKQRNLMPGVTREQAMSYAREVFLPALEPAAKLGVTLAMEPLGPAETDFIVTTQDAIELIDSIQHPNFQLNLDVKAMATEAASIPETIRASKGYIAHVQVNDPNRQGPGMGEVKFEPIIAALCDVGYDGWLSVEAFDYSPGAEQIARKSIEYLRSVV